MKIKEIYELEHYNENSVYLIKEGLFLHAYERSAMRFVENIANFKVFRRFYKLINADVAYLGFPFANVNAILDRAKKKIAFENDKYFRIDGCCSVSDFNDWKSNIPLPGIEDVRPQILLRGETVSEELPELYAYKLGYDIMVEVFRIAHNLSREYKYTLGERLRNESLDLSVSMYRYVSDSQGSSYAEIGIAHIETMRIIFRLMIDLKLISVKSFSMLNVRMERLYVELKKET